VLVGDALSTGASGMSFTGGSWAGVEEGDSDNGAKSDSGAIMDYYQLL
jgi:hypothetical protein